MAIYVFLNDNYADWELGYVLPELRRNNRNVVAFGLMDQTVTSMGSLNVKPSTTIDKINALDIEALILPGGLFWPEFNSNKLDELVKELASKKIPVAGICAATGYLAKLGLLDSVKHTSNSSGFLKERAESYNGFSNYVDQLAVTGDNIITASGLGAIDFAHEILKMLSVYDDKMRETWFRAFKYGEDPFKTEANA